MNILASNGRKNFFKVTYTSDSPRTTRALGALLARELRGKKGPTVLALKGDLGSGKTTFLKGFARGLAIRKPVSSPTFLIARGYKFSHGASESPGRFYHVDAYRISRVKEFRSLGWERIVSDPAHIVAIEWAEHVPKRMLPSSIEISFSHLSPKRRIITLQTSRA